MSRTQIEGDWLSITEQRDAHFGKLPSGAGSEITGERDQLLRSLRERYVVVKDEADRQIEKLDALVNPRPSDPSL
jgi:hypothetical protein